MFLGTKLQFVSYNISFVLGGNLEVMHSAAFDSVLGHLLLVGTWWDSSSVLEL
jgi:hypothetical protein